MTKANASDTVKDRWWQILFGETMTTPDNNDYLYDYDTIMNSTMNTITLGSTTNSTTGVTSGVYTTGIGGYTFGPSTTANPIYTTGINGIDWTVPQSSLKVTGQAQFESDVEVKGDIKVDGVSLKESLLKIEERLLILRRNEKLEARSEELRELGEKYRALEQEIIYMDAVYERLKS
jgi:hypothetical protein